MKRPEHRDVMIWATIRTACDHLNLAEFELGLHPAKPAFIDLEAAQLQIMDARAILGQLANYLADEAAKEAARDASR